MKTADLRKSILQYAVEGKLVPQDIHDEPASILYDKIIKEKESLIKQGKIKKEKPLPPITDDEIPYNIPENWKWVRLGEVCVIKRGNGLTKNDFTNSGIPCIHYGQIHKYYKYSTNTTMTYTSEQIGKKLKTVEYSDIIMAITSENIDDVCKSIAWLGNFSIVTGGHTAIIKHWINPLYLIYLFHSNCFQMQKNKIAKGMKVIEVSSEKLKNIIFPLPPLKEQERIVKKIDELMALCDKLEQEEEKLSALDKHFADTLPKSILQYAVEGKLVPQDIHDEPASLLYDKIIKEKENLIKEGKIKKEKPLPPITDDEIPYDIPKNWKWVRLGEVCEINKNTLKNDTNPNYSFKYIDLSAVKTGQINIPDNNIIFKNSPSRARRIIKKNDVIIATVRPNLKGFAHIDFNSEDMIVSTGFAVLTPYNIVDSKFLYHLFYTELLSFQINKAVRGTSYPAINSNDMNTLIFPLPPLKEQERIVEKVDELLTYCNNLKEFLIRKN